MSNIPATGFEVGANVNPFEAAMRRVVDAARSGESGVSAALGGLAQGPLAGLQTAFQGIAAILAGGFMTKAVADTAAMAESSMDLGRALGISTNEARAIAMAMEDIGATTGEFEGAAKGLSKQLKENEDDLNKMGLVTRDAAGNLRPLNDLVADGIQVLGTYKEGTDRGLASQVLFGKGVDASSKLMLYNAEVLTENQKVMQELGLEVGENAVAAWGAYDSAMDRAGFGLQGIQKAVGDALMPVMTTLVEMFNSVMPAAITVVRGALGGLSTVFLGIRNGVVVLWETINAFLYSIVEPIRGLYEVLAKGMVGDFAGAANAFKSMLGNVSGVWDGAMTRMSDSSRKTAREVAALFSQDVGGGSGGGMGEGSKNFTNPKEKGKGAKDRTAAPAKEPSQMPIYEAELARKIALFEKEAQAQGTLRQFSKTEEAAYWKEVSALAGLSAEDKSRAEKKWRDLERGLRSESFAVEIADLEQRKQAAQNDFAARVLLAEQSHAKTVAMYGAQSKEATASFGKVLEEKRKQSQQMEQLELMASQRLRERALADIEMERQSLQFELDAGLITKAQLIAAEQSFEQQKYELQAAALAERKALIDPDLDPVEYARIKAEILQLEQQHTLQASQLRNQASLEETANVRSLMGTIEGGWSNTIKGMLNGTQTLGQGIRGIFQAVGDAVIGMMAQMAAKWMMQQIAMRIFGKTAAQSTIAEKSSEAGAAGVASMAAAPFPLNMSAPVFGAAMAAAAMAFATVPSAAGGFDIPFGLNPLTQLHEQEMVLPKGPANVIRSLAEQGGDTGQSGAGGGDVHLHVSAMDGQSVARLFRDNGAHLVSALQSQRRNFGF